jgi:WD40 repeat protein
VWAVRSEAHAGWVRGLAFEAEGGGWISGGEDRRILRWPPPSLPPARTLEAHTDWVRALAFSPNSRLLASGGDDNRI